jgi:aminoglycoside 2'-N-acetyltransferase I
MGTLHTASTDAVPSGPLSDLRVFLDSAFGGQFTDDDWHHALGGIHVWVTESRRVLSRGSLVERTLVCSGETLRVGYVEAVATAATHRGRRHGTRVMKRIEELIRERYCLGVLSSGVHPFYETLGWERWRGPTFVSGRDGPERTPDDDDGVMILRTPRSPHLDPEGDITCNRRSGDLW